MSALPKQLQSILWSKNVHTIDPKRDKVAIIHHVLAYGSIDDLRWLFHTYPQRTIREVFVGHPVKIYTPPSFTFAKRALRVRRKLPETTYVKSVPRRS